MAGGFISLTEEAIKGPQGVAELNRMLQNLFNNTSGDKESIRILNFNPALTNDRTVNGITVEDTVGEDVIFGEVLYMKSDGKYWKADASASSTMPILAIASENISADATGNLLHQGYIKDNSWSFTAGNLVYSNTTAGDISTSTPTGSGEQVQVVGQAIAATIIYFDPNLTLIELV